MSSKTYDPETGQWTETQLSSEDLAKLREALSEQLSPDGSHPLVAVTRERAKRKSLQPA